MTDEKDWKDLIIADLGKVVTGKTPSTSNPEYFGGDIPFVTPTDMDGRRIISTTERYLTEMGANAVKGSKLPEKSVIVSCIGSQMGKVAIVGKPCVTNQQINAIVVSPEYSELFVYYSLSLRGDEIRYIGSGSAVPILNKSDFSNLPIAIPPLPEQRAIAGILGALDDKIELNRRMNRTLEAMARAVFRHWFVENEEVESWKVGKLGDLVTLINERVDATPQKDNEKYIALDDMPSKSIDLSQYRLGSEVNSSIISFKRGDILFGSMRPYFHKVGIAPFDGITRTTTFVLRPKKDIFRAFALYWFFSDEVIEFSTTASVGTTIPYVRWETLENYEIPIPSHSLMEKFTKFFQPLWLKIVSNGKQSRTLAALRDALLPKLMSGEVRVRP
ncbi:MAG: restriction endonuclease subunit S [Chloroflexota bacterium]|nr:restriction endonuclease subunit S [Chloroflexota bacterium]MBI5704100.1 restriction endonuclease subunit S [Chloroflexota bacterium]